jgi:Grx4 family monothiol glutaredoxin
LPACLSDHRPLQLEVFKVPIALQRSTAQVFPQEILTIHLKTLLASVEFPGLDDIARRSTLIPLPSPIPHIYISSTSPGIKMSTLLDLPTEAAFHTHVSSLPATTLLVLSFHAPWAAPCAQMRTLLSTLASTYPVSDPPRVSFVALDAEGCPDISETYDVTAVPFLVLQRNAKVLERISGCDAAKVRAAVERHVPAASSGESGKTTALPPRLEVDEAIAKQKREMQDAQDARETAAAPATNGAAAASGPASNGSADADAGADINTRLAALVKAAPVMLFMKGTPSAPQCGFSRQLVSMLRTEGVRYGFFNILADEDVRQGLKVWADWPTFPQLWIEGELVGGLDIVSFLESSEKGCRLTCDCDRSRRKKKITHISSTSLLRRNPLLPTPMMRPRPRSRLRLRLGNPLREAAIGYMYFLSWCLDLRCGLETTDMWCRLHVQKMTRGYPWRLGEGWMERKEGRATR